MGCSEEEVRLKYEEPTVIKYTSSENVIKYKKAFRAGWEEIVLGYNSGFEEGVVSISIVTVLCEAPVEATEGWYAGQDYANDFLEKIRDFDTSARMKRVFLKKLQDKIREGQKVNHKVFEENV